MRRVPRAACRRELGVVLLNGGVLALPVLDVDGEQGLERGVGDIETGVN